MGRQEVVVENASAIPTITGVLLAFALFGATSSSATLDFRSVTIALPNPLPVLGNTTASAVRLRPLADLEIESPSFSPAELARFRARKFERTNRWS